MQENGGLGRGAGQELGSFEFFVRFFFPALFNVFFLHCFFIFRCTCKNKNKTSNSNISFSLSLSLCVCLFLCSQVTSSRGRRGHGCSGLSALFLRLFSCLETPLRVKNNSPL